MNFCLSRAIVGHDLFHCFNIMIPITTLMEPQRPVPVCVPMNEGPYTLLLLTVACGDVLQPLDTAAPLPRAQAPGICRNPRYLII